MATTTIQPGAIITDPETGATYFGIPVVYFGEDGDMLALGHHTPRRALAAFNRHARSIGLRNVADDPQAEAEDWLDAISQTWLVFTRPNPAEGDDPDYVWYAVPATAETPNAMPVTLLTAA
ncbi:hypothetical protein [Streptomyces sp. WAC01280]|uniref:hypothetical protein n=1 Tax=Streptomyces sp. WAC01280 TaxID=2487424 RepID=UPI000F782A8D|nr:hypothetical protein [Streptomyces sp. WAC01280]RSS59841.1 hypothetical protein EF909_08250 [Streptomyces sp. WAC01280]